MILRTTMIASAVLGFSSVAMAQGVDLGARGVVIDQQTNARAMQEAEQWRAIDRGELIPVDRSAVEAEVGSRVNTRIGQPEAIGIAREQGVDEVGDIRQSRSAWTIDGVDSRGEGLVVRVSDRGEVLGVKHR